MDNKQKQTKRKRYKKFKDMTRPQQFKLVRSLTIVGVIVLSILVYGTVGLVKFIASKKARMASAQAEGDIFSRGYDDDLDTTIFIEELPVEIQESIEREEANKDAEVIAMYKGMKRDNDDFAGYLKIEGTDIEYPVMYSPEEPERYLAKDFELNKSSKGLPFIDARCSLDPASDNLLIYGHNMKDGSLFGNLELYSDIDYCKEHPVISFDTIDGTASYDVMYAFYDRVYYDDETDFRFYDFINASNKEEYAVTMSILAAKSIYDVGVKAEYGDKLITLVTCSYQEDEGRFVVVAKKK